MILSVLIFILVVELVFVGFWCYAFYLEKKEKKLDIAKQEKELKRLEKLNDYEDL